MEDPEKTGSLISRDAHGLLVKKPQAVEHSRKKMTDPFVIENYFDLLYEQLEVLKLFDKPGLIWNLDETSVCTDLNPRSLGKEKNYILEQKEEATLVIFKPLNVWTSLIPGVGEESYPNIS